MMFRMSVFTRRRGMSPAEFQRYWKEVHAPIAVRIPRLQYYEQNLAVEPIERAAAPAFDGVCKLAFEDASSMQAVLTPEMVRVLREDEAQFIEGLRTAAIDSRIVLAPPADDGGKLVLLVERRADWDAQRFERAWRDDFARQLQALPGVRGYTQNFVRGRTIERQPATHADWPVDCIDELWLSDDKAGRGVSLWPRLFEIARGYAASVYGANVRVNAPAIPREAKL